MGKMTTKNERFISFYQITCDVTYKKKSWCLDALQTAAPEGPWEWAPCSNKPKVAAHSEFYYIMCTGIAAEMSPVNPIHLEL